MTILQAVNYVLRRVRGYKVSALDTGGSSEQAFIEDFLNEEILIVSTEPWHYNTRSNVTLTPDASTGQISIPAGTTTIDSDAENESVNVTPLGDKLYDKDNNTDDFSDRDGLKVTYTVAYAWGCMPLPVREYVAAKTARVFAESPRVRMMELIPSLRHEEQRLRTLAKRADAELSDVNILETDEAINIKGRDPSTTWEGGQVFPGGGIVTGGL